MLCGAALTDAVSGYMALVDIGCASVSVEVQGVLKRLGCGVRQHCATAGNCSEEVLRSLRTDRVWCQEA
jgi:hypothetical protein